MAGLSENFLPHPLFLQPFLGSIREDSHDKLFAPIPIVPPKLNIGSLGVVVVLCLMKSKGHRSPQLDEGRPTVTTNAPCPAIPHGDNPPPMREGGRTMPSASFHAM